MITYGLPNMLYKRNIVSVARSLAFWINGRPFSKILSTNITGTIYYLDNNNNYKIIITIIIMIIIIIIINISIFYQILLLRWKLNVFFSISSALAEKNDAETLIRLWESHLNQVNKCWMERSYSLGGFVRQFLTMICYGAKKEEGNGSQANLTNNFFLVSACFACFSGFFAVLISYAYY